MTLPNIYANMCIILYGNYIQLSHLEYSRIRVYAFITRGVRKRTAATCKKIFAPMMMFKQWLPFLKKETSINLV